MKLNYIGFAKMGNIYGPAAGFGEYTAKLPAGHYKVDWDNYKDELMVTVFTPKVDEILNLGCKEFNMVVNSITKFLSPETKELFKKQGYLLKRSFLFHGPPGTGKSVLSVKVSDLAVHMKDAIALYPVGYEALERMLEVLDETDKERFKVICLEEFDGLISGRDEDSWTTLLDGQFQSDNRMLLATTNNIAEIPQRLLRPGRFSSLVHIPALDANERYNYLKSKGLPEIQCKDLTEKTNDFTVDDLKEVVQNSIILGEDVNFVLESIRAGKSLGKEKSEE